MATYKAEFLAHHYAGRGCARAPTTRIGLAAAVAPPLAAAGLRASSTRHPRAAAAAAADASPGSRTARSRCSRRNPFSSGAADRGPYATTGTHGRVLLWPDTFTNYFHPHIGSGRRRGPRSTPAGGSMIPAEPLCCGLTWISTGQLATAKRVLRRTGARLAEHVRAGGLVVGLEPSCTAVFRSDAPELFPDDQDVARLRDQTVTLAELLLDHTPGWLPRPFQATCTRSPRCTATSTRSSAGTRTRTAGRRRRVGRAAGVRLLRAGRQLRIRTRPPGRQPGLRRTGTASAHYARPTPNTAMLADGFSCRTQIHELSDRDGIHLAELLAAVLDSDTSPDWTTAQRPTEPPRWARITATAAPAVVGLSVGSWLARALMRMARRTYAIDESRCGRRGSGSALMQTIGWTRPALLHPRVRRPNMR